MERLVPVAAAIALIAALGATSALAKGASEALITGPGLGGGITLGSDSVEGSEQLGELANSTGFYSSVFATASSPTQTGPPAGDLGPRYTITYSLQGPNGADKLRQDVYPYATPRPVTHTAPDQLYFGTQRTVGGWFVAAPTLKDELIAAGLPATPPGEGNLLPARWVAGAAVAALAAALVTAVAVLFARRRSPAGSHAPT